MTGHYLLRKLMFGLILIVVEYGLGDLSPFSAQQFTIWLNPYCSGIWSRR